MPLVTEGSVSRRTPPVIQDASPQKPLAGLENKTTIEAENHRRRSWLLRLALIAPRTEPLFKEKNSRNSPISWIGTPGLVSSFDRAYLLAFSEDPDGQSEVRVRIGFRWDLHAYPGFASRQMRGVRQRQIGKHFPVMVR